MASSAAPALRPAPHGLLIDGRWGPGSGYFEATSPSRPGERVGRFALAGERQVAAAYEAAAAAQPAWASQPAPRRADVLQRAAAGVERRAEEAARLAATEMGKAIRDARAEVTRTAAILSYFAGECLQPSGETYPSADGQTLPFTVEEPAGVVCAITPWNFPFAIPAWKIAPALAFGNAVVWKSSELASASAVLFAEVLQDAGLPGGVLNLLTGPGAPISASLTGDPALAALTFTGSGAVGWRLRREVADRPVKVQLELGGKNAAIVLPDADLDDAAEQIVRGAMLATGQRCTATSRLYVHRDVHDRFVPLLAERVRALRVGDPLDEATDLGPLASRAQHEKVARYLRLAREAPCQTLCGGGVRDPADGFYVEPTVLTGVPADSPLLCEEIFGPVLVVAPVDDLEHAIAAANDTAYGLSAAIFTREIGAAMTFARRIAAGVVHVNRETAGADPHLPFGGMKASSSLTREQGKAARQFFTTTKTVYVRPT